MSMTTKSEKQIENLKKLKQIIKSSDLIQDEYLDECGCMCVVGHMANEAGVLDSIVEDFNGDSIRNVPENIVWQINMHYGLSEWDLYDLQRINDAPNLDWIDIKIALLNQIDNYLGGN